jgi:hypothetical protein
MSIIKADLILEIALLTTYVRKGFGMAILTTHTYVLLSFMYFKAAKTHNAHQDSHGE